MNSSLKKAKKMSRIDYSKYSHSEYAIHMGKLLLDNNYFCVKFWADGLIKGQNNRRPDGGLLAEDFFILISKLLDESSNGGNKYEK